MKWIGILGICLGLIACSEKKDTPYYWQHPAKLQERVEQCKRTSDDSHTCQERQQQFNELERLAYELQSNPQFFGLQVITLQEAIARQKTELKQEPNQAGILFLLRDNRQKLEARLAVVKWLASPGG